MKKILFKSIAISLGLFLWLAGQVGAETSNQKAIIILDASGSMFGQIQNKTKMEIAKDVLKNLLKDWNEDVLLGLMAYGHREKGNCSDIEMIYDVDNVNKEAIISSINKLTPKGKTPLSQAVVIAAEKLKYTEEKAVVILLSDGKETCNADPCQLTKSLDEKGIDFTVHLIGFDITDQEQAELRCIAENTGGNFYRANNASELHQAMATSVRTISKPDQALKCQAFLTEGAEPIDEGLSWVVYGDQTNPQAKRKYISGSSKPNPTFKLKQGRYLIEVRYGEAIATKEVDVIADKVSHAALILGSGTLKLNAIPAEGADPIQKDLSWVVYGDQTNPQVKRKYISGSSKPNPTFKLNQGRYLIEVRYGEAIAIKEVDVIADKVSHAALILGSGTLKLNAIPAEGADPIQKDLSWVVYGDQTNPQVKRKYISGSSKPNPTFKLNQGRYLIEVRYGEVKTMKKVDIIADKPTHTSVIIASGTLRLSAIAAKSAEPIKEGLSWIVYGELTNTRDKRQYITGSSKPNPVFKLAPGRYLIECRFGEASAKREVEIQPEKISDIILKFH